MTIERAAIFFVAFSGLAIATGGVVLRIDVIWCLLAWVGAGYLICFFSLFLTYR